MSDKIRALAEKAYEDGYGNLPLGDDDFSPATLAMIERLQAELAALRGVQAAERVPIDAYGLPTGSAKPPTTPELCDYCGNTERGARCPLKGRQLLCSVPPPETEQAACKWEDEGTYTFHSACGNQFTFACDSDIGFDFCPFCGKRVESTKPEQAPHVVNAQVHRGYNESESAEIVIPAPPGLTIVDRDGYVIGVTFTGTFPSLDFIKAFKPWNKK